jgi:protease I
MSNKVAVLMTDFVEDIEFTSPKEAIEDAGYTVEVITPDGSDVNAKNGGNFKADKATKDASPEDYAGLLVPGGFSPDGLRGNPDNAEFAKYFLENDKPTFAICHGPQFLIDTDLLNGRNVTSVGNVKKDLINAGAKFHDESVVVCHNLVTSRTPDDLDDFNGAIKDQLK